MANKYASVPQKTISSVDVPRFDAGWFLNGAQNAPINSFVKSKDVELDRNGFMIPRRILTPFLPDTVGTTYQKYPVLWGNILYYFTLDANKAKFCKEGDSTWTDCGGTNSLTTNNGGFPKLIRTLNCVMILNGKNGDKLAYIDLLTAGFPVVKYSLVADPTVALTATRTNLTAGAQNIYAAYNYSGAAGNTLLSPILTTSVNLPRDQWGNVVATPGSLKFSRPAGAAPAGARFWNLYLALAPTAGTIQTTDMLQLIVKIDLNTFDVIDDGTLSLILSEVAPIANSTEGPRVSQGIVEDGNPILFADEDNLYNIWIGGGGPNAMDFSVSNGGYRAEPEKGTNYYPTTIIGFRTGQGVPALTVLYSNTEGLSKQAVLQQQTVNYGDQSFTVWGVTEQHYGAAGVAAPNSAINYNGKLLFLSTDGFASMETQPSAINVLAIKAVSSPIDEYIRGIINSAMPTVVGAGWNNKYMWLVPNAGFTTPQQILVLDTNSKGIKGDGAWYTLDIPANWIGTVSPQSDAAFVYISQGKKTFKLLAGSSTYDLIDGLNVPFSTGATGAMIGMSGSAHNSWQAGVQAMFYVMGLVGDITVGVTYRDLDGKPQTKTTLYHGPVFVPSTSGGWGDSEWSWGSSSPSYAEAPTITDTAGAMEAEDARIPVDLDDIFNEAQWFYSTPVGFTSYKIRSISYEGVNLGIRPDLR